MASSSFVSETQRLAVLDSYQILDTPTEQGFDDIVILLSQLLKTPIAAVNLIAENRQWFKAEVGLGARQMPLDNSICKYALLEPESMVVPDTRDDARLMTNPLVRGEPGLRFYAGAQLRTPDGVVLGTLCALDIAPRPEGLSQQEQFILNTLAHQVMTLLELRKSINYQRTLLERQEQARCEIEHQRDQTQRLLEGMDEGFIFLDHEFRVRQINAGGLRLETRSAEDIIGVTHWDAWPGSEHLAVGEHYRCAMRDKVPANFEQHYVFPDGRSLWLDVRAYPANDGLAIFYRDITARKMAETKLRQTNERLEFTLRSAEIGDWDLDLVNNQAYRSLRHDQCFGYCSPVANWSFDEFLRHVHPDDRQHVSDQFARSLSTLTDWRFDCRVIWPDGTVHWISAHGSVYGSDATPTRMTGIVYEITERKRTEQELVLSEQQSLVAARQAENERRKLDALLESVPVGIIVADAHGTLVRVNAENRRIWGDHPMSSSTDEYVHWKGWWADGSDRHGHALKIEDWAMSRALKGELAPRQIIEVESFDPPHARRIVINSGAPIFDNAGVITGAVVTQMDITDRIAAEAALRDADQKKDEFLAMLAHELRNPLAPIMSAAALLSRGTVDANTVQRTSAIITRQSRHMTGLIDDLLDVSRVTRGKVDLQIIELDLKDVIADALEQVRPLVEMHGHQVVVELSPTGSIVNGDRKRLVQVMTNLLSNAAKYTPKGGRIDVLLETGAQAVQVTISDNGIGMSGDLIRSAFDLFSQGKRGLDRSQGGLGIGLALVRSLLALHGGTVSAHSAGPGQGSTFTVHLPGVTSVHPAHPGCDETQSNIRPLRIAVVDDNEDAAATLAMLLQSLGHEVTSALSARDAVESLPIFSPDVCLLDIGLPETDGFELARLLRADPATSKAVLVAVTGYAQQRDRDDARQAGFDHLFAKPVDVSALNIYLGQIAQFRRRAE